MCGCGRRKVSCVRAGERCLLVGGERWRFYHLTLSESVGVHNYGVTMDVFYYPELGAAERDFAAD